jgi:hypothetical protein
MIMTWCLSNEDRDAVLAWARMPESMWNSLAIVHQMAVYEEYYYRCKHKYVTFLNRPAIKQCVYCGEEEAES